jgi:hypothetical protein
MPQEMVTALDAHSLEAAALQGRDHFLPVSAGSAVTLRP